MSTLSACVSATAAELGLKESDVREIADRLEHYKKTQIAAGTVDRLDEKLRGFAKTEAERVKLAAALKRKQAALNIILRDEWERDLASLKGQGTEPVWAVAAKLVGIYTGVKGARKSAAARRVALEGAWQGGMLAELRRDLPQMVDMLKRPREAKPLLDDVVREWRKPGSTKNADARKAAEILAKYGEAARIEANRAGANIGKLDGWGGPQAHDEGKLLKAGKDRWVRDLLPFLDLERSFGEGTDEAQAAQILSETWENIVTGRGLTLTSREKGQRVGPSNLANSLAKHRVLQFKDADGWIAYNDVYGRGNVVTGMIDHFHHMARTVANMQVMGPNPQVFLDAILETERRAIREGGGSIAQKNKRLAKLDADLDKGSGILGRAFAEVMGDTYRPANLTAARWGSGIRAVESMAKLGGAVISSVTDLVTYAHQMRFQGRGILESYGEGVGALFQGKSAQERRQVALMLGVGADTMLGDIHARFDVADNVPGQISKAMNTFFKLSGLTWWTDRLTNTFATMSSAHMAEQSGTAWAELSPAYKQTLGLHGITEERWALVQQLVTKEGDYRFIWPEAVRSLPDDAFGGLEGKKLERARSELELDLRSFFSDEAGFGVIRADDRTRMFTTQGTAPGSGMGEAIRFLMQFKTFPVAYTQKVLAPAFRGRAGAGRDWGGIAHLIGMTTILGYVAMVAKDAIKNRTPKDPTKYETVLAAFAQGGGLGIYGDFLFGQADRFGGTLYGKVAGPTIGTAADVYDLYTKARQGNAGAGDAFWLALNNTPYANLWYTRAALDLAILNQMQEWISPGTLSRREKSIQKQFGQRYIVDPLPLQ